MFVSVAMSQGAWNCKNPQVVINTGHLINSVPHVMNKSQTKFKLPLQDFEPYNQDFITYFCTISCPLNTTDSHLFIAFAVVP